MKKHTLFTLVGVFCLSFLFTACESDEMQAISSIQGVWDVTSIASTYGEVLTNGFASTETLTDSGMLGSFEFGASTVNYSFTRNDTAYSGSGPWNLRVERVNEGFIQVNKYTLTIDDDFVFNVTFGDATSDSHINATQATFVDTPTEVGPGVIVSLSLEKR